MEVRWGLYTFIPSDADDLTIDGLTANNAGTYTATIYDSSEKVLGTKSISNVGIRVGYQTALKGTFFSDYSQDYGLTIENSFKGIFGMTY